MNYFNDSRQVYTASKCCIWLIKSQILNRLDETVLDKCQSYDKVNEIIATKYQLPYPRMED